MNKTTLIRSIARKTSRRSGEVRQFLDAYMEVVSEALLNKDGITLANFGSLSVREQAARMVRIPTTGEKIMISSRTSVQFRPGKGLINSINN